jgi:Ca2+-binding EF-hand superfamily protein
VKRPNFNAKSAFKHADRDEDGAVTVGDLRETLAENAFYATDKEISLIMNKFDKFSDSKITMTDFVEELQPRLF